MYILTLSTPLQPAATSHRSRQPRRIAWIHLFSPGLQWDLPFSLALPLIYGMHRAPYYKTCSAARSTRKSAAYRIGGDGESTTQADRLDLQTVASQIKRRHRHGRTDQHINSRLFHAPNAACTVSVLCALSVDSQRELANVDASVHSRHQTSIPL